MDHLDKNITKAFSTYTQSNDIQLEESVMNNLLTQKNYSSQLLQSNKKIKTGVSILTSLLTLYLIINYSISIPNMNNKMDMADMYSPSIFTAMLVFILFMLASYSLTRSKNKLIL